VERLKRSSRSGSDLPSPFRRGKLIITDRRPSLLRARTEKKALELPTKVFWRGEKLDLQPVPDTFPGRGSMEDGPLAGGTNSKRKKVRFSSKALSALAGRKRREGQVNVSRKCEHVDAKNCKKKRSERIRGGDKESLQWNQGRKGVFR